MKGTTDIVVRMDEETREIVRKLGLKFFSPYWQHLLFKGMDSPEVSLFPCIEGLKDFEVQSMKLRRTLRLKKISFKHMFINSKYYGEGEDRREDKNKKYEGLTTN